MAGPDLSIVTDMVDFVTVVTAVVGVFGAWAAVYVLNIGIRMFIRAIGYEGTNFDWEFDVIDEANDRASRGEPVEFGKMMAKASIRHQRYF